jgi:paraquat-inducible protein B
LRIGAVTDDQLDYDEAADKVRAMVRYQVEPDRIAGLKLPENQDLDTTIADLVRKGLRIKLESANIITGAQQLAMDTFADAPPASFAKKDDAYVLMPLDDGKTDIATAAGDLIAQLRKIPFEQIGQNLNQTLAGANGAVNDPNLKLALASLNETLSSTRSLMTSLNKGADPLLRRLPQIAADLEDTVKHTNQLVSSLDDSHAPGSQFGRDTSRLFSQLSDAARSVRILADLLSRHPEALIRGRAEQEVQ